MEPYSAGFLNIIQTIENPYQKKKSSSYDMNVSIQYLTGFPQHKQRNDEYQSQEKNQYNSDPRIKFTHWSVVV